MYFQSKSFGTTIFSQFAGYKSDHVVCSKQDLDCATNWFLFTETTVTGENTAIAGSQVYLEEAKSKFRTDKADFMSFVQARFGGKDV
jgi:hypothetical protein